MDLWQRSSLLPPSASLGSRHDDAAATLGQPRFLHGDPRGSQGREGQLRQPPPAPPGDLETVAAPWARGPHPPAASRPGWCFPPLGATFLKCTLARRWPDSQALGQRPTREVALAQLSRGARSGPTAFALVPLAGDALPIRGRPPRSGGAGGRWLREEHPSTRWLREGHPSTAGRRPRTGPVCTWGSGNELRLLGGRRCEATWPRAWGTAGSAASRQGQVTFSRQLSWWRKAPHAPSGSHCKSAGLVAVGMARAQNERCRVTRLQRASLALSASACLGSTPPGAFSSCRLRCTP